MLYDYNQSKLLFPYWKFKKFNIKTWDGVECSTELRFEKEDLPSLMQHLNIPNVVVCQQGSVCSGMEGLCTALKRLAYPCRCTDMAYRFGRSLPELCLIFNKVIDIYENNHHCLTSWDQPFLSQAQLNDYAHAIHQRGAPLQNCF